MGHCKRPHHQGASIPSLLQDDGSLVHSAHEKANLLAKHFSGKMSVPNPEQTPPTMPHTIKDTLLEVKTSDSEVREKLLEVDENKAMGARPQPSWHWILRVPSTGCGTKS
ncbi:hypothetical protein E2C01_062587 [Portunus trituberculatus]|uniref:Uncharacterized protein n=1 Tax=Portunus trituberculatus TaxID=210409 RepID=A0A5B7HGH3_PORTR|nr:hypothetical protein [Portunus trituberculatus]